MWNIWWDMFHHNTHLVLNTYTVWLEGKRAQRKIHPLFLLLFWPRKWLHLGHKSLDITRPDADNYCTPFLDPWIGFSNSLPRKRIMGGVLYCIVRTYVVVRSYRNVTILLTWLHFSLVHLTWYTYDVAILCKMTILQSTVCNSNKQAE